MGNGKLFVFSGASGVGKSTVLKKVMAAREDLSFSVSATTRPPRPGEEEGVSYYFVSQAEFRAMIARDEFLEHDMHMSNYYGTPRPQLEEKLKTTHVILDVEPNGAFQVKRHREDAVLIFVNPPSLQVLENRLRSRGDTSEEQITQRLKRAQWEMAQSHLYDYIVVNEDVDRCTKEILNIIAREADR